MGLTVHQSASSKVCAYFHEAPKLRLTDSASFELDSDEWRRKKLFSVGHSADNRCDVSMIVKIASEASRFASAIMRFRAGPISTARRYLRLYRDRKFSPNEIQFLNLLDPKLSPAMLSAYVSKEELLNVQLALNSQGHFALTEEKVTFSAHCQAAGLPVPAIHAVYDSSGRSYDGMRVLRDRATVAAFLETPPCNDLIVKPVDGVHGEGVMRLRRHGDGLFERGGQAVSADDLLRDFAAAGYRRWMFQERVAGHPDLRALSGADGLQTVRVVTLIDRSGRVRVLAGRLRLICNDGVQDNFDFGRTGNLIANLDLESGRIRNVVGSEPDRLSIRSFERHPRSGRPLIGFALPHWPAAKAVAEAAADAFRPLRTIGWDVAVTPDRPCLIEGNVTWDTLIGEPRMGAIYAELRQLAGLP